MSSSETLSNLNIRKFPSRASFNAATPGSNDLCMIVGEGQPLTQVTTMPTAVAAIAGEIYQYKGATDANYTNGYIYKCVGDGGNPETYSWTQTNVQPAPSGLPDQTGQSGKFLITDGIDASWADIYKVPTSVPDLLDTDWVLDSGTGKYNQTINVTGVTATNTVFVSPLPASADDWASSNILCTAQGAGTLTFACDTVPSTSGGWIGVNVVIFG